MKRTLTTAALATSIMLASLAAALGAAGAAQAASSSADEWVARVERVSPGGREFVVAHRDGRPLRVVRPVRPLRATDLYRLGELVNANALTAGDTVLLSGVFQDGSFVARRVEVLDPSRAGGATTTDRVLRLTRLENARDLRGTGPDGAEYRVVLPTRPQAISVTKDGDQINLSALREGDRFVASGAERDHVIVAHRIEVLDASRLGRGGAVPLRLTYRGPAGWRCLNAEGADGSRYTVLLPRRPQALYFRRNGSLVELSALEPGQTIEVRGILRGQEIDAAEVVLR